MQQAKKRHKKTGQLRYCLTIINLLDISVERYFRYKINQYLHYQVHLKFHRLYQVAPFQLDLQAKEDQ